MDLEELRALWPLPGPWGVRPSAAGTNNRSYVVQTPAAAYYLRISQNTTDEGRVRYEHAVLAALGGAGLSFAVPAPCPTRAGATAARLQSAGGGLATLCPLIPGRHPRRRDPREARLCGAALGELDAALGALALDLSPGPLASYADLAHIHPLVPDPRDGPSGLALTETRRARVQALIAALGATVSALFATLPQQVIHSDYGASNVLLEGGRVSGVLDFEFAGPGPQVMDFAVGLTLFLAYGRPSSTELALGAAFGAGYLARLPLTPGELVAVPLLMRLYRTVSLIHRAGRYRQGVATAAEVMERVEELEHLDSWLATHEGELVEALRRAGR